MLTSIIYSYRLWKNCQNAHETANASQRIQTQTWLFIVPFALIQLATGFSMISTQNYDFSESWISGSVIGFIIVIGSWFSFIYFLLMAQQLAGPNESMQQLTFRNSNSDAQFKFFRKIQSYMLLLCGAGLLSMIFFMANKSAALYVSHP